MKTFYISKHATTSGIVEVQGDPAIDGPTWREPRCFYDNTEVHYKANERDYWHTAYRIGKDAFETIEEARADGYKRIARRRDNLTKQIAKLDKIEL